jgi:hypothetical protein
MIKRIFSVAALSMLVACGGGDDAAAGGEGADSTATSVTTVPGQDTVNQPTVVPTTDSVVQTTTVETDTVHGQGQAGGTTTTATDTPAAAHP